MGLFKSNYNKPGPGVPKDAARKKGLARFFEVVGRDMSSLFKANVLCALSFAPGVFFVGFGLSSGSLLVTLVSGILGGLLAGPFYTGLHDTVLRSLRDEPGYWWHRYKRAFLRNWKQSLLPGALLGLLVSTQVYTGLLIIEGVLEITLVSMAFLALNLLITAMCFPYLFAQIALVDLSFFKLLRNSLLLAMSSAPRALIMAVVQVAFWAAMITFLAVSPLIALLFGFWLMVLISQMLCYPTLERVFDLEAQFAILREKQMEDNTDD